MVGLYKDPTGSEIFKKVSPTTVQSTEVDSLKKKVSELESELKLGKVHHNALKQ
jgi:hypothetical protein